MIRIRGASLVAEKPAKVVSFLADVANESKWLTDVVHVKLLEGEPGKPRARWERVQVVAGRNIKTVTELVEASAKRLEFKAAGKVIEYRLTYTVTPAGRGCEVTMDLEGEMLGFASMFEGIASEALEARVPAEMERLASIFGSAARS